ncbi:MAG: GGDEF domain-containing protein [Thermodesulfovibrio sp.]|nr:GGDEF domain-containing protein [Thermodesulfovibrio sp.]
MLDLIVKKIMTKNPICISETQPFSELIQIMGEKAIGSVIVTDKNFIPYQILTLRDILKILSIGNFDGTILDVLSFLNKQNVQLITVNESEPLLNALDLMKQNNISHIPVLDKKNRVVGIISLRDILREFPGIVFIDTLTGVNNRTYLSMLTLKLQKLKTIYCVLMIDIDNFKLINDKYGHSAGDRVLREIAKTIRENVKGYDEVIRYGGEEFVVILYRCPPDHAFKIAERLRQKVKLIRIPEIENSVITVSIGMVISSRRESLDKLIKKADEAMYTAKREGKDRVKIFTKGKNHSL